MENEERGTGRSEYKPRQEPALSDFIDYCQRHPTLRFWQSLYGWVHAHSIQVDGRDPFYWEGKNGNSNTL